MEHSEIKKKVATYYGAKLESHGPSARGVDWNSEESQILRFRQFLMLFDKSSHFTINDFGCGYGRLFEFLSEEGYDFEYWGLDFCEPMIAAAAARYGAYANCHFIVREETAPLADYSVASGIFNVKLDTPRSEWESYVFDTLEKMNQRSRKGFGFNVLTSYSDPDHMRQDLYYSDPCLLLDHCVRNFSRHVALMHDYGLYEFTLLVRK
jgi:SAM-dependent methyltransferase